MMGRPDDERFITTQLRFASSILASMMTRYSSLILAMVSALCTVMSMLVHGSWPRLINDSRSHPASYPS